jgi:hypothetical protein
MQFAQRSDTRRRASYGDFIRARDVQIKERNLAPRNVHAGPRIHPHSSQTTVAAAAPQTSSLTLLRRSIIRIKRGI